MPKSQAELDAAREQWDEAIRNREVARGRSRPITMPYLKPKPAKGPRFLQEHCDGCQLMLARGSLRNVLVDAEAKDLSGWKMLCSKCRRKVAA